MALAASHRYSTKMKTTTTNSPRETHGGDDRMHYLILTKHQQFHSNLAPSNKAPKVIDEYHQIDKHSRIQCLALGKNTSYAICNSAGRARWCYFPAFSNDMKHEDRLSVKQISFGPHDTYAIVKANGQCTHMTFGRLSDCGPWQEIERHQADIKYVAMTANKSEWIVGYGRNQWVAVGVDAELIEILKQIKESDAEIVSVTLGKTASRYVVRSSTRWYYKGDEAFSKAMKQCDDARLVAIW